MLTGNGIEPRTEYIYHHDLKSLTNFLRGQSRKFVMIFQKNVAVRFNFANFDIRT